MRIPRIYHPEKIQSDLICLTPAASNHIARVLRMQPHEILTLFDGTNYEFSAIIDEVSKNKVTVKITDKCEKNCESPIKIHLGQVISRGDKMEFTIQKCVELGVCNITPLFSKRCGVKLNPERLAKKQKQWQQIAISACEQSGRNIIPTINPVETVDSWCSADFNGLKLNLHPRANLSINTLENPSENIKLLIGPEGGLSEDEILMTTKFNFTEILLGPRILRTETAALTAITALQVKFGDLG